ncbi:hypothetical protein D3C83_335180 [compost metagenome]
MLCHNAALAELVNGMVRNSAKPAAVTNANDGARPCSAMNSPASKVKPSTQ